MNENDSSGITTPNKTVAVHVKQLLSGMASHAERHLAEVDNDLHQTRMLLEEAIAKLTASFIAIHSAVTEQQQIIDEVGQGKHVSADDIARAAVQTKQISRDIDAVMVGLQFQDMTDQLIRRTSLRVAGVRNAFTDVHAESDAMTAAGDPESIGRAIKQLNQLLQKHSEGLDKAMWKAVCQTHMESGDIDLF